LPFHAGMHSTLYGCYGLRRVFPIGNRVLAFRLRKLGQVGRMT
jgi:hypothetical protein